MSSITAHPLTWPQQFPRKIARERGQFKTSLPAALKNVEDSLRRFGADSGKKIENLVMSSNVTLGVQKPKDPGVAVWFIWDGLQVCIPVDRYETVESNLQAIHHIIEARRVELRHGTLALVRASFTGFKALPAPKVGAWREVLGFGDHDLVNRESAKRAYLSKAKAAHPDGGGSAEKFDALTKAWEQAQQELQS